MRKSVYGKWNIFVVIKNVTQIFHNGQSNDETSLNEEAKYISFSKYQSDLAQ
jgi:hypothetical protein